MWCMQNTAFFFFCLGLSLEKLHPGARPEPYLTFVGGDGGGGGLGAGKVPVEEK